LKRVESSQFIPVLGVEKVEMPSEAAIQSQPVLTLGGKTARGKSGKRKGGNLPPWRHSHTRTPPNWVGATRQRPVLAGQIVGELIPRESEVQK
jgi:hypothetical protein